MNTIKKILLICSFLILGTICVFADIIDDFEKYNYDAAFGKDTYKIEAISVVGNKKQEVQIIVNPTTRLIYTKNKLQKTLFLYKINSENAWMMSDKAKQPLKISLTQKVVSNTNIQDLAGINIKNNFDVVEEVSDNEVLLKSNSKKTIYPYISIKKEKTEDSNVQFVFIHRDINKKAIKQVVYRLVRVNGKTFWMEAEIQDLIFDDVKTMYMDTLLSSVYKY